MSKQSDLADLIHDKFVGVEPDSQDVVLEDHDWHLILSALTDYTQAQAKIARLEGLASTLGNKLVRRTEALEAALIRADRAEADAAKVRWNTDMDAAPHDRMIIALARYAGATAGAPTFVAWSDGAWWEYSRNAPERMVCWAWIDRDALPEWPAEPAQTERRA